jgi:hypothetical protein
MRRISIQRLVADLIILLAVSVSVPAAASAPIDATLYTTYNLNGTTVDLSVCGSTQESSGCYGGGTLGPFVRLGALIEGNPSTNLTTNTVTRYIYALDVAAGTNSDGVDLYIYKKTDVITPTFDNVSVTLFKTVSLPLPGGSSVSASMAANAKFLFIGTNRGAHSVSVQKSNFAIVESGAFTPPIPVTAITADQYGYVTVTFGKFSGFDVENGSVVYGPDGSVQQSGGGASFMLNTNQAVLPTTFP